MMIIVLALLSSLWAFAIAAPPPLGKLVDIGNGRRVHLYCSGSGTPTVMVVSGGFSFDWGLVQPEVARFTRVCTYDPSGSVWSDPTPVSDPPKCSERVAELHALLTSAKIDGPYVLVGYSIGGLYARLYAQTYPSDVSGMVIVDHAFLDTASNPKPPPDWSAKADAPPVLLSKPEIVLDLQDDWNFAKLPQHDQDLHRWAMSLRLVRPTPAMAAECSAEVESLTRSELYPLRRMPVVVISTRYDSANYQNLQKQLLSLSRDSSQMIAENSSHMVIIDGPEVVVRAIQNVIEKLRR